MIHRLHTNDYNMTCNKSECIDKSIYIDIITQTFNPCTCLLVVSVFFFRILCEENIVKRLKKRTYAGDCNFIKRCPAHWKNVFELELTEELSSNTFILETNAFLSFDNTSPRPLSATSSFEISNNGFSQDFHSPRRNASRRLFNPAFV